MHAVIEDGREVVVQDLGEDEFPVYSPEAPEDDTDKHPDGEGRGGKHQVTEASEALDKVCQEGNIEEDELEQHVEEGEVLGHSTKLVPVSSQIFRHLDPVDLVMHRPGKADDARHLETCSQGSLDHLDTKSKHSEATDKTDDTIYKQKRL